MNITGPLGLQQFARTAVVPLRRIASDHHSMSGLRLCLPSCAILLTLPCTERSPLSDRNEYMAALPPALGDSSLILPVRIAGAR